MCEKYANFRVINIKVRRDLINKGLKSYEDSRLAGQIRRELKKADRVKTRILHLISVYEKVLRRCGL